MKQDYSSPVQLRGNPGQLATILRLPDKVSNLKACSVNLPGINIRRATIRPIDSGTPGLSMLRIKLPVSTPPGAYEGTVQIGSTELPILIDVEPRARVRLLPRTIRASTSAASVVKANLVLLNGSNFTINLEKEYRFCVFERGGIDRAIFLALTSDRVVGDKRVERLLDELARSHGGRVRLEIESGSGAVRPTEARDLCIALHFSDRLRPGRAYSGAWRIENTSLAVTIQVTGKIQEEVE